MEEELAVTEAQWSSYVGKLRQSGQLGSCLAVADVSGSMYIFSQPQAIEVCCPLPLLNDVV